jgi:hypothetical protein
MSIQSPPQLAAWVATATLLSFAVDGLSADVITLNGGGTAHGKVVPSGSSKTVALTTSAGTLIVFDRQAVKGVKRDPQQKTAAKAAKRQLTPEEKAWLPKVRSLVERAYGPDRDQSRRAVSELLKIDDENAIPALARNLAAGRNDESRRFYSTVLHSIPGSKAVYCLVEQSLFDPSPNVRDAARKAIGTERGDLARPLYIQALKVGNPNLASLAAKGIGEIGDPNGDAVPYLIDSLIFQTVHVVATSRPAVNFDTGTLSAIQLQNQLNAESQLPANTPSVVANPDRISSGTMLPYGSMPYSSAGGIPSSPLATANVTLPPLYGPIYPPMFGAPNPQIKDPAIIISAPVTMRDIMNAPLQYSTGLEREKNVNQAVYDTLVQVTGQQLGNNLGNWRRWWANQLKNRSLQKPKSDDQVISKPTDSPDRPLPR